MLCLWAPPPIHLTSLLLQPSPYVKQLSCREETARPFKETANNENAVDTGLDFPCVLPPGRPLSTCACAAEGLVVTPPTHWTPAVFPAWGAGYMSLCPPSPFPTAPQGVVALHLGGRAHAPGRDAAMGGAQQQQRPGRRRRHTLRAPVCSAGPLPCPAGRHAHADAGPAGQDAAVSTEWKVLQLV